MVKTLQPITDDNERQKAFLRTKTNLLKKSRELSVLCDVKLGVLIDYPPQYPLMIWPPDNPHLILSLIDSLEKKIEEIRSRLQCIKERRNYLTKQSSFTRVEPDDAPLDVDPNDSVDLANHLFQSKSSIVSWDQLMMNPPTPKYDGAGFNFQEVPAASYNYKNYDHGNMGVVPLLTQGEIANNSHAVYGQPLQEIDQTCLVQKNCNLQEKKASQLCGPAMRQPPQAVSTFAELMQH